MVIKEQVSIDVVISANGVQVISFLMLLLFRFLKKETFMLYINILLIIFSFEVCDNRKD